MTTKISRKIFIAQIIPIYVFDTFAALEAYARAKIQAHPDIECVAYDDQHTPVQVFRNDAAIHARVRQNKKPWWQFWV